LRHKDLHGSATRQPCVCRIENTETEYASFVAKIDVSTLGAASEGPQVVNPDLTFAELVDAFCLLAPPNEPRNYRLRKWKDCCGDRIAWSLTVGELAATLEALSQAGMASSTHNRALGDLKAIYNWAIREQRRSGVPLGVESPAAGIRKLPEVTRRVHVPAQKIQELLTLAKVSTYLRMYGLVLAALASGARKNELR